ncbi:MAG TPA: 3-oxoacyl-ACP reductase family protein [Syntrophales bacterium]|nr:3-oxoacyl-ACP reductase family protein [Syntrophales bacterium]
MKLKDKVAIITGGGQGIGKEYALGFAREGAIVVIAEIKLENAQRVVKEIESQGGKAIAVRTDVTSEADAREVVEKTIATFGRIDALVNNAAIYYGLEMKPFEFLSEKEWDAMMAVNVKGLFIMSKAAMPQMKKQKSGSIINISSGTWLFGIPYLLHYVTSKAAVVGFTRALAREIGEHGIRVNAISPGFTMSEASKTMKGTPPGMAEMIADQTSLKRNQQPEDLVGACVFLASDDSGFITGQLLNVDGGWVMH